MSLCLTFTTEHESCEQPVKLRMGRWEAMALIVFFYGFSHSAIIPKLITADVITAIVVDVEEDVSCSFPTLCCYSGSPLEQLCSTSNKKLFGPLNGSPLSSEWPIYRSLQEASLSTCEHHMRADTVNSQQQTKITAGRKYAHYQLTVGHQVWVCL